MPPETGRADNPAQVPRGPIFAGKPPRPRL